MRGAGVHAAVRSGDRLEYEAVAADDHLAPDVVGEFAALGEEILLLNSVS